MGATVFSPFLGGCGTSRDMGMALRGPSFSGKGQREPVAVLILLGPSLNHGEGSLGTANLNVGTLEALSLRGFILCNVSQVHTYDMCHSKGCSTLHGECDCTHTAAARDVFDIVLRATLGLDVAKIQLLINYLHL